MADVLQRRPVRETSSIHSVVELLFRLMFRQALACLGAVAGQAPRAVPRLLRLLEQESTRSSLLHLKKARHVHCRRPIRSAWHLRELSWVRSTLTGWGMECMWNSLIHELFRCFHSEVGSRLHALWALWAQRVGKQPSQLFGIQAESIC